MSVVDKLMVIISANAKEFNSTMDGVAAKTEKTQTAMGKISGAGKAAGANLARAFAGATMAAGAFAVGVKKLGPLLESYGDKVDSSVTNSFYAMNKAMDDAGQTMAIQLGNGMAKASGGFVMLVTKITDTVKNSKILETLFTGLGYVFAVLSVSIGKVVSLLSATVTAFQIVGKEAEKVWNTIKDWNNETDLAAEANEKLNKEIIALEESMDMNYANFFDWGAYEKSIAQAQVETKKFADTPPPQDPPKPTWMAAYIKGLQDLKKATDEVSKNMTARLAEEGGLQYENELRASQLKLEMIDAEVEKRVWAYNQIAQLEAMKTQIINANMQEQESAKARFDANWQSSEQFKLEFLSGVMGNMASLMDSGSKKMFKVGKIFAISQALIDTYRGISASLALGFPLGWVAAAATAVAGFANVAKIKNSQFGGGGGGTSSPVKPNMDSQAAAPAAAASGPQQTNVNVTLIGDSFGQGAIRGLIGQINGATSDNMRLNVAGRS